MAECTSDVKGFLSQQQPNEIITLVVIFRLSLKFHGSNVYALTMAAVMNSFCMRHKNATEPFSVASPQR